VVRARMTTQVHHLSRLIEDLLDVTRIDQGKINLRLERVSVQTVLDSAVETSRPKVIAGHHSLEVEGPVEPAWIMADFTRVSQILSNLLTNAAKYTPPEGALHLATRLEADTVVFEISDNGVGIPLELQAGIFDLYTQAPGPDGRSAEGLGIGLALVRQLVQLHKGDISVRSDGPGQGSTFTVRLPRAL
jgi:signal transduction histidine kinase